MSDDGFAQWCVVDLMGHQRLAGRCTEQEIAGVGLLRVDLYLGDAAEPALTEFVNLKTALYKLTPVSEAAARAFTARSMPVPLARWELEPPRPPRPVTDTANPDDYDEDEDEDADV